jgi:uncharacterized protein YqgC (DUF456 family)
MERFLDILQHVGIGFGYVGVVLLCVAGVILSCISISGTWLVTLAALLTGFLAGPDFPIWWVTIIFALVSGAVEGVEALAGMWGVKKRGGSGMAGFAALVGGLGGLFLGGLIPIPVVGPLLGMLAGGFLLAYLVERAREKKASHAAHIAWGSVIGRVVVIFVKVMVTMGMIVALIITLVASGWGGEAMP